VLDRDRVERFSTRSDPRVFRDARCWLARIVGADGWSSSQIHDLTVVLNEACSNAHRHAYSGRIDGRIDLELRLHPVEVELAVRDYGKGFDPGRYRPPDLSRPNEGGYGIHLMHRLTDRVEHRRMDPGTLVVMTRRRTRVGEEVEHVG
jgi:serine/threonine-protein kinase RsbW